MDQDNDCIDALVEQVQIRRLLIRHPKQSNSEPIALHGVETTPGRSLCGGREVTASLPRPRLSFGLRVVPAHDYLLLFDTFI